MPNPNIPLTDQITCIERELAFRRKLYPQWVERKSLTQEGAEIEINRMEAVLATLKGIQARSGGLFDNPDEGLIVEAIDR